MLSNAERQCKIEREEINEAILTRRIALSITMSLYDPLGYICPLTIRMKWLLQQLGKPEKSSNL